MSDGCVSLGLPDVEWLHSFASTGTRADVHHWLSAVRVRFAFDWLSTVLFH
jgi:hypothetical protein